MSLKKIFAFGNISKWIGVIILPGLIVTGIYIPDIKFNYDIDSFYDPSDSELISYNRYKAHFENENDYILAGIKNDAGIFNQEFLRKIDSLTNLLESKPYFGKVLSPTNLYETVVNFGMPVNIPLIHIEDTARYKSDKEKIYSGSVYKGLIFSEDEQSVSLIARIDKSHFPGNEMVVTDLTDEISRFGFSEYHLAGRTVTQFFYKKQMQMEMMMFIIISVLLVFVAVWLIFRSLLISLIVLLSLAGSLIFVYGGMAFFNYEITLIQTMLPLILLITGVSPCIHLIAHFRASDNRDRLSALESAFRFTFLPNTLNTFTTSLGFGTLYFLPMLPIREFAVITSIGILVTYFVSIGILTGILRYNPEILKIKKNKSGSKITNLFSFFHERKVAVYGLSIFLIIFSTFSVFKTEVKNNFLDDVPDNSELKSSLHFFENKFSGIRPLEIYLIPKKQGDTLLTQEKLIEIKKIQSYAETNFKAGFIFSPVKIAELTNKSLNGGNSEYEVIPENEEETEKLIKRITKKLLWNKFIPVYHSQTGEVRIMGRTLDLGSKFYLAGNDSLKKFSSLNTEYYNVSVTGASALMDNANKNITQNFISGIITMTVMIFLVILIYMRSALLALIGIVVNIIPVLSVFFILYFTGNPLKVSSALMFTVVYGIAVDDTIHFLSTFKKFKRNHNTADSIDKTMKSSGLSMIYTTIILTAGFSLFSVSSFASISVFGIVVAITLFIALCADLILLPVLLSRFG